MTIEKFRTVFEVPVRHVSRLERLDETLLRFVS